MSAAPPRRARASRALAALAAVACFGLGAGAGTAGAAGGPAPEHAALQPRPTPTPVRVTPAPAPATTAPEASRATAESWSVWPTATDVAGPVTVTRATTGRGGGVGPSEPPQLRTARRRMAER